MPGIGSYFLDEMKEQSKFLIDAFLMEADEILDHFFEYHKNIGSKAYLRMKTSGNISYFRSAIIERLEYMLETPDIMDRAVAGYMEVEEETDEEAAYDSLVQMLLDVKSSFYRLDDIIDEIDQKHTRYMRNAVMRAKFLLATGNNLEGKLSQILNRYVEKLNGDAIEDGLENEIQNLVALYPQNYISPESLQSIPVTKTLGRVDELSEENRMSAEERQIYKEALRMKNRHRFSRKNINAYVMELLKDRGQMAVNEIPVESRRDLLRIIYISIYAGNCSNNYMIRRIRERTQIAGFSLPYFDIIRKDT